MIQIKVEHISVLRQILKLKESYSEKKIDINFENLSPKYHPSVRPQAKFVEQFEKLVIAKEFLKYRLQNNGKTDEQIVEDWNSSESSKVEKLIESYKAMSKQEYEKAIEVKFEIFKYLFVFMAIATVLFIAFIVYLFVQGFVIAGVMGSVIVAIAVAAYLFRGPQGNRKSNLFPRKRP